MWKIRLYKFQFWINKRNLHKRYQYRNWEGSEFQMKMELNWYGLIWDSMRCLMQKKPIRKNMLICKWIPNWKADSWLHLILSGFVYSVELIPFCNYGDAFSVLFNHGGFSVLCKIPVMRSYIERKKIQWTSKSSTHLKKSREKNMR